MGWTGIAYTRKTHHLQFSKMDAFFLIKDIAHRNKSQMLAFDFQKATNDFDKHFCYCVFRNQEGSKFINIFQLVLENGQLSYFEESNFEGSIFTNCPIEFLELLDVPKTQIDRSWRMKVLKNNYKINQSVVLSRFKLVLKFTDLTRYETLFMQEIDIRKYPQAINLRVGDRVSFGLYGILEQNDFFESELYPFGNDKNLDLTLLVHRINTERILLPK